MNPTYHPTGFRIANAVVAASFALPYAFQLLPPGTIRDEACVTPSLAVGGLEGEGLTRYWDEAAVIEEKKYEPIMSKIKTEPVESHPPTPPLSSKDVIMGEGHVELSSIEDLRLICCVLQKTEVLPLLLLLFH